MTGVLRDGYGPPPSLIASIQEPVMVGTQLELYKIRQEELAVIQKLSML